jgi:diguanylate cyclase (GGDEF)-like protein
MPLVEFHSPPVVLLVEDHPDEAAVTTHVLTSAVPFPFAVRHVLTLQAALTELAGGGLDLVLLDLLLPDASGIETLERVFHATREVPVVVMTATEDEDLAIRAVQSGAQDYLVKGSMVPRALSRTLRHAIERHRLLADLELSRQREAHRATHDPLTGLPNRTLFFDRLTHALARALRYSERFAVIFIDLDRFKDINDTKGHAAGDQVLVEVAERLRSGVRQSDTLARLAGDEFTVLFERLPSRAKGELLVEELVGIATRPIALQGDQIPIMMSAGLAVFPEDGRDADTLVAAADAAMYRKKLEGRGSVPSGRDRRTI